MPFPPYSNDYPKAGNIDYDMFVIDPGNEDLDTCFGGEE